MPSRNCVKSSGLRRKAAVEEIAEVVGAAQPEEPETAAWRLRSEFVPSRVPEGQPHRIGGHVAAAGDEVPSLAG